MRQAKEEEQADIEEFDEDTTDKGEDTVRYVTVIRSNENCTILYLNIISRAQI